MGRNLALQSAVTTLSTGSPPDPSVAIALARYASEHDLDDLMAAAAAAIDYAHIPRPAAGDAHQRLRDRICNWVAILAAAAQDRRDGGEGSHSPLQDVIDTLRTQAAHAVGEAAAQGLSTDELANLIVNADLHANDRAALLSAAGN